MSDNQQPEKRLPLPEPRSPRALDERILARARSAAPQRSGWSRPAWAGGLVTASVVGIALLISEPDKPAPAFDTPAYEVRSEMSVIQAEPAAAKARTEGVARERSMARPEMREKAPADAAYMAQPMAQPAPIAKKLNADSATLESIELDMAPQDTAPQSITPQKLAQRAADAVDTCLDLLAGGDAEKAQACYELLVDNCANCGLPDTLQEAATTERGTPKKPESGEPAGAK